MIVLCCVVILILFSLCWCVWGWGLVFVRWCWCGVGWFLSVCWCCSFFGYWRFGLLCMRICVRVWFVVLCLMCWWMGWLCMLVWFE